MAIKPPNPTQMAEEKYNRNTDCANKIVFNAKYGHKMPINWPIRVKKQEKSPVLDKINRWL